MTNDVEIRGALATSPPAQLPRRIAVGVDGFSTGEDAAVLGRLLSEAAGAELILIAVHPDPIIVMPAEATRKGLHDQAQRFLTITRTSRAPSARTKVEVGASIPRALLRAIARERCDMLVLGSNRRAPKGEVQIASATRQLLGQAGWPLAIAPRGLADTAPERLSRIAVGYDGEPESQAALCLAAAIAERSGASLEVVAVVDDRLPAYGASRVPAASAAAWDALLEPDRAELEGKVRAATQLPLVSTEVRAELGEPAGVLKKLSEDVDLIVIGSRRWGTLARVLLGSTGEEVLRGARCPVLVAARPNRDS
jgi:nucleotide-binding universal stress UspA family protein